MEYVKNFLSWILVGFIALGFIIMYGVSRANHFNFYFVGVGLFMCGIPVLILWIKYRMDFSETETFRQKGIDRLKKSGLKVDVDLIGCELKSNSWRSIESRYSDRIQMLNAFGGDAELNVKYVDHQWTNISFVKEFNGRKLKFSGAVPKDIQTVKILFEMKQVTSIYIDKNDFGVYYFDLEFMDS